jgi:hypothetical protein
MVSDWSGTLSALRTWISFSTVGIAAGRIPSPAGPEPGIPAKRHTRRHLSIGSVPKMRLERHSRSPHDAPQRRGLDYPLPQVQGVQPLVQER